jgi:hypothetical protein
MINTFASFSYLKKIKGPTGNDGSSCPMTCPTDCGPGELICPGGVNSNGCPLPDLCKTGTVFPRIVF